MAARPDGLASVATMGRTVFFIRIRKHLPEMSEATFPLMANQRQRTKLLYPLEHPRLPSLSIE
jgi:hypothetical protein